MSTIEQAAQALLQAYRTATPIAPLTPDFPGAKVATAYRIQQYQVDQWVADGDAVVGHKIGLTSQAMQRQIGVDQPDFGHLTRSMFHLEHQPIPARTFLQPKIEPEFAFVLHEPLSGPGVTAAEALRAIDMVLPALEIVDSRIKDWQIGIFDTVADNASSGGVILGSTPTRVDGLELRTLGCNLMVNGQIRTTGTGGAVLGSPLNALVWLANTLGALGVGLEPGQVILPGSMTAAVAVSPGDVITAEYAGLGTVTAVMDASG